MRGPDPTELAIGRESVVTLSVEAAPQLATLGPLPRMEGLTIAGGPPVRSAVGGVETTTWTLRLTPLRPGRYTVPPLQVEVEDRTLRSGPLTLVARVDEEASQRGFVELSVASHGWLVDQPAGVTIRFGIESSFLKENVVQLFRRELDVPVDLRLPWKDALEGVEVVGVAPEGSARSLVVDGAMGAATLAGEEVRGGRSFTVFELTRTLVPRALQSFELPGPLMRFVYTTAFRQDFISGRVPVDRHDGFVSGEPLRLHVKLPPADPPLAGDRADLVPGVDDIFGLKEPSFGDDPQGASHGGWLTVALSLPLTLAGALLVRLRVRERHRQDPGRARALAASSTFAASLEADGADPGEAFAEYLAARLRCPPPAVVGPGLSDRLQRVGVRGKLARRAEDGLRTALAARYGAPAGGGDDLRALARELEHAFREGGDR